MGPTLGVGVGHTHRVGVGPTHRASRHTDTLWSGRHTGALCASRCAGHGGDPDAHWAGVPSTAEAILGRNFSSATGIDSGEGDDIVRATALSALAT